MDNKTATPVPTQTQPQANNSDPQTETTIVTDVKSSGSKGWIFIITGLIIAFLLIGGGVYMYMSNQQSAVPTQQVSINDELESISTEYESIDTGNVEVDFIEVDQDLQKL